MTLRQLSTVSKLCFLVYCQFLDSLRLRSTDPKSQEGVGLSITGICLGTDVAMALRYTISPEGGLSPSRCSGCYGEGHTILQKLVPEYAF